MPKSFRKGIFLISAILTLAIISSSCAPKIYGVRKHRKDRNCGCEYKIPSEERTTDATI